MIAQILQGAALLAIVALGGLLAERSGVLNIGLEGLITFGAFAAIAFDAAGAPAGVSIAAAALVGIVPAILFALFVLRFGANPFIVGLALNLLAAGSVALVSELAFGTRGAIAIHTGTISITAVTVCAIVVTVVTYLFLYHTVHGVRLRIAGEQSDRLVLNRISPSTYRAAGIVASGAFSALAGALLVYRVGVYLPNISAGRGWIGLVVLFLGYRRPLGVAVAALFFAAMEALAVGAQAVIGVPPTILLALPYLLTLVAFVTYSALRSDE
jgi:simple sugar transport system permease protein